MSKEYEIADIKCIVRDNIYNITVLYDSHKGLAYLSSHVLTVGCTPHLKFLNDKDKEGVYFTFKCNNELYQLKVDVSIC